MLSPYKYRPFPYNKALIADVVPGFLGVHVIASVDVARTISSICLDKESLSISRPINAFSLIVFMTLFGNLVDPIRAWMMATIFKVDSNEKG